MTFNTFLIPNWPNCYTISKKEANVVKIADLKAQLLDRLFSQYLSAESSLTNIVHGVPTSKMIILGVTAQKVWEPLLYTTNYAMNWNKNSEGFRN